MKTLMQISLLSTAAVLVACGGGGGSSGGGGAGTGGGDPVAKNCQISDSAEVNWDALENDNLEKLSDYNLFTSSCDPTQDAHGGIPYDLNTPLFSDYTSKYRFVFVPDGQSATYNENDVFDFPVGTVITKTFALPADTAYRGYDPETSTETLLETRLLIHRAGGWTALPYVWNADGTEATYRVQGAQLPATLVHNGAQESFTYSVPDKAQCKQCHSHDTGDANVFIPIGPKARHLNGDRDYGSGAENQLSHWSDAGILSGLPALDQVDKVPSYHDADAGLISGYSDEQLMAAAKGYLDVNCAHCHGVGGTAAYTGLQLEFWRDYDTEKEKHGVCKGPIAYDQGEMTYDVVPGNADESILHFRMDTTNPQDSMPRLGRALIHEEGVALVKAWINSLPDASCSSK